MAPMRRFGETWRPDAPYRQRPGAYAAILRGRMMLLAATPNDGESLLMPGGGVDPGESPMQALHREVMEEVGWTVAPIRRLGAFQRYCYMPDYGFWARKVCMIHLCRAGRRIAPPTEPDHTPVWMRIEDAADALSVSGERHFVRALLRAMR